MMKRFLTIFISAAFGAMTLSAQEPEKIDDRLPSGQDTTVSMSVHDTIVVVHEFNGFGHRIVKGYEAVEKAVTTGYQNFEDSVVRTFTDTSAVSRMYRKGYRADVELSCAITEQWGITTSHGYSFGNGLYVGGGVGFVAEFVPDYKSKPTFLVPVFADVKYSFIDKKVTPYVNFRAGELIDITNSGFRWFVNPALGIDISMVSIKVGYELQQTLAGPGSGNIFQCAKVGIGFTF